MDNNSLTSFVIELNNNIVYKIILNDENNNNVNTSNHKIINKKIDFKLKWNENYNIYITKNADDNDNDNDNTNNIKIDKVINYYKNINEKELKTKINKKIILNNFIINSSIFIENIILKLDYKKEIYKLKGYDDYYFYLQGINSIICNYEKYKGCKYCKYPLEEITEQKICNSCLEYTCNNCKKYNKYYGDSFCEVCSNIIGNDCGCMAIYGCQGGGSICKKCIINFDEYDIKCCKCSKDIRNEYSTNNKHLEIDGDWFCIDCEI